MPIRALLLAGLLAVALPATASGADFVIPHSASQTVTPQVAGSGPPSSTPSPAAQPAKAPAPSRAPAPAPAPAPSGARSSGPGRTPAPNPPAAPKADAPLPSWRDDGCQLACQQQWAQTLWAESYGKAPWGHRQIYYEDFLEVSDNIQNLREGKPIGTPRPQPAPPPPSKTPAEVAAELTKRLTGLDPDELVKTLMDAISTVICGEGKKTDGNGVAYCPK